MFTSFYLDSSVSVTVLRAPGISGKVFSSRSKSLFFPNVRSFCFLPIIYWYSFLFLSHPVVSLDFDTKVTDYLILFYFLYNVYRFMLMLFVSEFKTFAQFPVYDCSCSVVFSL